MKNSSFTAIGKVFFALAILCIGVVHLVTKNFPTGLLPVPAIPCRGLLVYVSGIGLIISALLILSNKFLAAGAWLAAVIWLIFLLALEVPNLIMTYNKPDNWTPTFEVAMLLSGALLLVQAAGSGKKASSPFKWLPCYLFAAAMLVFAVLHFIYAHFIAGLITGWIPCKLFWAYFVGAAFLAVAISIVIRMAVRLSAMLVGLMFLTWFFILHIPLVLTHIHIEPQWTSMFIVLASSGEGFLIAGWVNEKGKRR